MIKLHYVPDGIAVPDFQVDGMFELVKSCVETDTIHNFFFSTENIFLRVRVAVNEGEIPHGKVLFCYKDHRILLDENGRIDFWPDGFLDTTEKLLERMT